MATILVVDDLAANRQVLVTLLRYKGHRLLEAEDGSQGLLLARSERPDLVITDVLMPVMDGYEFVKQLRADPATRGLQVVFYTAHYGEREARALALSSGVADVLTKPVEPEHVLRVVDRVLSGKSKAASSVAAPLTADFDRQHLRLVTDQLSAKARDLGAANARLRALINIGLELASEQDSERLLQDVCVAARDLFGATYVTLGVLERSDRKLRRLVTEGTTATGWVRLGEGAPGVFETVVSERRAVRLDDVGGDPTALGLLASHPEIHAFLAVPLASPSHVYGWVCLVGNEGRPFTQDDEALVTALAGQVGRIYENGYFSALARKERDRAQRYLDTAEVILLALDLDGRITQVNRYACNLLGWPADQLIGRDWVELCLPERTRTALRKRFDDLVGGDLSIHENPILTRSGDERLIEWRNTLLRDGNGLVTGTFSSGTDITERTKAQAQMHLQSVALNAAANAIVITDRVGRIEWVNPAFSVLTGYTTAEAIGRDARELVKSDQQDPAVYKNLWDTILAGDVWRGELINRRKDFTLYSEEQAITPVRDVQGEISHFIAVKQDVTRRKRQGEELRQRARLSALSAAVGLSLAGSDSLAQALQKSTEALVTHLDVSLSRIWTLNENQDVLELQASAGLSADPDGSDERIRVGELKIGRIARDRAPFLTNSVVGNPEVDDQDWVRRAGIVAFVGHPLIVNDRVVGVMAIFAQHPLADAVASSLASVADHIALGIERYRNEAALRTAEERMRFALKSANVGIWDLDFVTGRLQWSDTLEVQYGVQPGKFAGTFDAFLERVHPDDREALLATVDKATRSGTDFFVQNRAVRPDGTVRWLAGAGRMLLDENNQPLRGIGISLDITERRSLEDQYQQAQKMEAIGRLAGGIAHDFNNLLTAILGYCELVLGDVGPDSAVANDITQIQKAGQRAAGLTRQLLDFSRKQIIEPTRLDLSAIVTDMRSMLERLIGEDVRVVLGLKPDLAPVNADRSQMEQIILNLAVNARDAMPKGGTLTIETANVELDENYASRHFSVEPGWYVVLVVTDTGIGMTRDVQERLFEPFFTTKELGKGTGLGLATVHGIVARAGGSVGVYSEIGRGTSFKVYLPRTDTANIAEPEAVAHASRASAATVLVVEDEHGLRELAKRLLERRGYRVLLAANAIEATQVFENNASIDVLLTDVVMPGASGPELTRALVGRSPGLKVIYMSGYTEEAIVHHGVLDSGIAFVHKPFTAETLGRKIQEVLSL